MHFYTQRIGTAFLVALCALMLSACGMRFVAEKNVELTHALNEGVLQLSVSNVNGEIKVIGADTNTLDVRAHLMVRAGSQRLADNNLEKYEVSIEESGDSLVVSTNAPKTSVGLTYIANFEIIAPKHLALKLRSTNGKVLADGVINGVDAETTNGEVELRDVVGKIQTSTVNGRVHGRVLALRDSGNFNTVNGQIDISIFECSAPIRGSAVNGQVIVRLPDLFSGRVDASVVNGNIRCDFDLLDKDDGRRHLRGRIGDGGDITVHLSSVNGQVRIGKS